MSRLLFLCVVLVGGAYSLGRLVPTKSLMALSELPIGRSPDGKPISDKAFWRGCRQAGGGSLGGTSNTKSSVPCGVSRVCGVGSCPYTTQWSSSNAATICCAKDLASLSPLSYCTDAVPAGTPLSKDKNFAFWEPATWRAKPNLCRNLDSCTVNVTEHDPIMATTRLTVLVAESDARNATTAAQTALTPTAMTNRLRHLWITGKDCHHAVIYM